MCDFWLFLKKNDRVNPIENVKIMRYIVSGFGFGFRVQKFSNRVSGSGSTFRVRVRVSGSKIFKPGFGFGSGFKIDTVTVGFFFSKQHEITTFKTIRKITKYMKNAPK